jgi:hypothetical protein
MFTWYKLICGGFAVWLSSKLFPFRTGYYTDLSKLALDDES